MQPTLAGEWMLRRGTETVSTAAPSPLLWIAEASVPPEIQTAFESASLEVLSRLRQILGDDIVDRYLAANREQASP